MLYTCVYSKYGGGKGRREANLGIIWTWGMAIAVLEKNMLGEPILFPRTAGDSSSPMWAAPSRVNFFVLMHGNAVQNHLYQYLFSFVEFNLFN